jgi:hypothetical protein
VQLAGDPDLLYALASRIAAEADVVRERAHELSRNAAEVQWKSSGAQAFRDRIARDVGALGAAAAGMDEAVVALRHHADAVRERLEFLRNVAERAVHVAEGVVKDAEGALHHLVDGPWW